MSPSAALSSLLKIQGVRTTDWTDRRYHDASWTILQPRGPVNPWRARAPECPAKASKKGRIFGTWRSKSTLEELSTIAVPRKRVIGCAAAAIRWRLFFSWYWSANRY